MTDLIIVTAGGLARELLSPLRAIGRYQLRGFVDDDQALADCTVHGVPVLGPVQSVITAPHAALVIAAGRGSTRRLIAERLCALGVRRERFATIIDPSVVVPQSCVIGPGSIVLAGVVLTADVTVGRHVVIMPRVTLTHDDVIEDFATLCAGVSLGGAVRVGAAAYVGMNAGVREGRTVGAGATLGMGAAAITDLPAGETWAGVPARRLDRASW